MNQTNTTTVESSQRSWLKLGAVVLVLGLLLSACGSDTVEPAEDAEVPVTEGPAGEPPTPASEVQLTDAQISEVQSGNYTAALVWHIESGFTEAVSLGARQTFEQLGISVVAETIANFDATQQANDIETVMALNPDIILTLVVDGTAAAEYMQPAVDAGVQISLLSNPVEGWTQGQEYVGIVTDDLADIGIAAADMLAEGIGGSGEIGFIFHDTAYYVTNQRDQAFKAWIQRAYPDIDIVDEQGTTGDVAQAEEITNAMLTRYPDLDGIYTPWAAGPADGVLAALNAAGNDDVAVVTIDIDTNVALDLAEGGNMVGIVADEAYNIGRTMATETAAGLIGVPSPPFAVVPAIKITADNLIEGYYDSQRINPPQEVYDALRS